jgi:hypothetical protein
MVTSWTEHFAAIPCAVTAIASWKRIQTNPTTACGTYDSCREVISSEESFTFTDARASSRCSFVLNPLHPLGARDSTASAPATRERGGCWERAFHFQSIARSWDRRLPREPNEPCRAFAPRDRVRTAPMFRSNLSWPRFKPEPQMGSPPW